MGAKRVIMNVEPGPSPLQQLAMLLRDCPHDEVVALTHHGRQVFLQMGTISYLQGVGRFVASVHAFSSDGQHDKKLFVRLPKYGSPLSFDADVLGGDRLYRNGTLAIPLDAHDVRRLFGDGGGVGDEVMDAAVAKLLSACHRMAVASLRQGVKDARLIDEVVLEVVGEVLP